MDAGQPRTTAAGCRCSRVVGVTNAHLEAAQTNGATYDVDWVDIDDPNPTFPFTPGRDGADRERHAP